MITLRLCAFVSFVLLLFQFFRCAESFIALFVVMSGSLVFTRAISTVGDTTNRSMTHDGDDGDDETLAMVSTPASVAGLKDMFGEVKPILGKWAEPSWTHSGSSTSL